MHNLLENNLKRWSILFPKEAEILSKGSISNTNPLDHTNLEEIRTWFSKMDLAASQVIYLYGLGSGSIYQAAKEWLKSNPHHYLIILEEDPATIKRVFETDLGREILEDKQCRLVYVASDANTDEICEKLASLFAKYEHTFLVHPAYIEKTNQSAPLQACLTFWTNVIRYHFGEYSHFGKAFYLNFYQNLSLLPEAYQAKELFHQFESVPAIICGAGPSLDKNLPILEQLGERALIFAGGTALNAVNSNDFLPHFGLGIDPNSEQETRLIMNNAFEVPFFYRSRFFHEALKNMHAPKIYVTGSGSSKAPSWFEKNLGIEAEALEEGFNVINFSTALACALGCNPIIFVGVDLAYTSNRSYQSGVMPHPLHQKYDFRTKSSKEELLVRSDIYGQPINTLWKWLNESIWYGQFVANHPQTLFINATEGGIGMPGVANKTLQEVADQYLTRQIDLRSRVHGDLENSHMAKNVTLERIHALVQELITSLNSCIEGYQRLEGGLAIDREMKSEIAYQCILEEFEQYLRNSFKLEREQIAYDMHLTEQIRQEKYEKIERQIFASLKDVAAHHLGLLNRFVLNKAPEKVAEGPSLKRELPSVRSDLSFSDLHYPNGALKFRQYHQRNRLEGPSIFYGHDGQILALSQYRDGKKEGVAELFFVTGEIYSSQNYQTGMWHGDQVFYYRNGQLKTLLQYDQGRLHGQVLLFYPNGKKKRELKFKAGKREGFERAWDQAGRMLFEVQYRENKAIGTAKAWHGNGQFARELVYDDQSRLISHKRWDAAGQEVPESEWKKVDYFDAMSQQTEGLTQSLGSLYEHLSKIAPLLAPGPSLEAELEELHKALASLEKTSKEISVASELQGDANEQIWKTPSSQRQMQMQMEEITKKLQDDLKHMHDLFKEIDDDSSQKK